MRISTKSAKAAAAQVEAFDRILSNHLLYCTVCDNNNGSCAVHNTTKMLGVEHQHYPFEPSRTRLMKVIPSTATIPTNASCAAVVWKPVRTWK
jgi:predicted molibdopterin-dependent oxidoreductase YjgC